jgi:hypothetical protein
MYEFRWQLPGPSPQTISLRIHARRDWFGVKTLTFSGRTIYRRLWLSGIEHRFRPEPAGPLVYLRLIEEAEGQWRPALYADGCELPEQLGTVPPHVPHRPTIISVVTGLTYLAILIAIVMLPSTEKMLRALRLPHADRKLVLTVTDPALPNLLHVEPVVLDRQPLDQALAFRLTARGGVPPYRWAPVHTVWPKGMALDSHTGEISFVPRNPTDYQAEFVVTDARGINAAGALVVAVELPEPPPAGWPTIQTPALPEAQYGAPYEACMDVVGAADRYVWKRSRGTLPKGLALNADTGCLSGTPSRRELAVLHGGHVADLRNGVITPEISTALGRQGVRVRDDAQLAETSDPNIRLLCDSTGRWVVRLTPNKAHVYRGDDQYVLTLTVEDPRYKPGDDIRPWIIPVIALAASLLGYWNMRRWGVLLLAVLFLAQIVIFVSGVLPLSAAALVVQVVILIVGVGHLGQMR